MRVFAPLCWGAFVAHAAATQSNALENESSLPALSSRDIDRPNLRPRQLDDVSHIPTPALHRRSDDDTILLEERPKRLERRKFGEQGHSFATRWINNLRLATRFWPTNPLSESVKAVHGVKGWVDRFARIASWVPGVGKYARTKDGASEWRTGLTFEAYHKIKILQQLLGARAAYDRFAFVKLGKKKNLPHRLNLYKDGSYDYITGADITHTHRFKPISRRVRHITRTGIGAYFGNGWLGRNAKEVKLDDDEMGATDEHGVHHSRRGMFSRAHSFSHPLHGHNYGQSAHEPAGHSGLFGLGGSKAQPPPKKRGWFGFGRH